MPEQTSTWALMLIGMVGVAYLAIRVLCAPYFLWREQRTEIEALKSKLVNPETIQKEQLVVAIAKQRENLAHIIGEVANLTMNHNAVGDEYHERWGNAYESLKAAAHDFYWDSNIYERCLDAANLSAIIFYDRKNNQINKEDRDEFHHKARQLQRDVLLVG